MKTIILGVGNPILGDDGAGLIVAKNLKQKIHHPDVKIEEALTSGMNLLDFMIGYDKAIIIDTILTPDEKQGRVIKIGLNDLKPTCSSNPHDATLTQAVQIAEKLGEKHIPREITIIGITLNKKNLVFNEKLTREIAAAVPKAVEMTIDEIKKNGYTLNMVVKKKNE